MTNDGLLKNDATALRTAAQMLRDGAGPDLFDGSDDRYADWLDALADRLHKP